ncbi:MAG: hypothetical protein GY841_04005 [FCB group bacterium]|nr:hypothetical protein [FCB group bacterium]
MSKMRLTIFMILLTGLSLSLNTAAPAQEIYWGGFVEGLWSGGFDNNNPTGRDYPAAETRLQLRLESFSDVAEAFARLDFVQDGFDSATYDMELREAYMKFRLPVGIDFKVGRQILTWGTGDLVFINDVFAKDYQSFFIGRQDQYLKAPQTALRTEWYNSLGSFTLVAVPDFEPNVMPTGDRLSFYNPMIGIVGADNYEYSAPMDRENSFDNAEIAFRYARSIGGFELAGYAYRGFYKEPRGLIMGDPPLMYYPRLNVYGASLRGQMAGGIFWLEGGYYDSREDGAGDNYFVENSSAKGLIGFERQVGTNLTANLQVMVEQMGDYGNYELSHQAVSGMWSPDWPAPPKADEMRTLLTSRWTKQYMAQTLTLSLFGFYSPSDEDAHLRISTEYKYSDELSLMVGANIFEGNQPYTMFGQFDRNDNLYLKVNYGF